MFPIRLSDWCCTFVQVVRRVKVQIETDEDVWALKLLNFIRGVNQLLFDGLTREVPM